MDVSKAGQQLEKAAAQAADLGAIAQAAPVIPPEFLDGLSELTQSLAAARKTCEALERDLAACRQQQAALEADLLRYRGLFEFAPDGYLVTNSTGVIEVANWAAGVLLNLPEDALAGRDLVEFVTPAERPRFQTELGRLCHLAGAREWETCLQPVGLDRFDAALAVAPVRDAAGQVVRVAWLIRDVTAHKQAAEIQSLNASLEQRVRERTAELEAKNRELEAFTYTVSHDLKAPLRGIDGYSRILAEEHAGKLDRDGEASVAAIRTAVQRMTRLIDDLLEYARLEQRALAAEPLDLRVLVASLVAERAAELSARAMQVTTDIACAEVLADAEGLSQAIRNLLDNAIKFTQGVAAPAIKISAHPTPAGCVLAVRDNGVGFDMRHHDRIFGILQRLHSAEEYPGTGIGLAIVHQAMRRMRGRVWAEGQAGRGACFYLEIPAGDGAEPA